MGGARRGQRGRSTVGGSSRETGGVGGAGAWQAGLRARRAEQRTRRAVRLRAVRGPFKARPGRARRRGPFKAWPTWQPLEPPTRSQAGRRALPVEAAKGAGADGPDAERASERVSRASRRRHGPERPDGHGRGLRRPVPPSHEAVPAARGAPLPDQHLPGGRRAHVVPVGRAAGLHRQHLGLRLPGGLHLRAPQPAGAADRLHPGAEQELRAVCLLRALWNHRAADNCLQHLMGPKVSDEEPGPGRGLAAAAGGVPLGGEEHVRGRAHHARELPQAVHAAGRPGAAGAHVHDPAALRRQLLLHPAEHRGHRPDDLGGRGLQNQAGCLDPGRLAARRQRLLQRLLDRARLQAHARLPQVRLLPDHVGDRRLAAGGGPGPWRRLHGREEERVVTDPPCLAETRARVRGGFDRLPASPYPAPPPVKAQV